MTVTKPKFHPAADLFPLMQGVEFDELVADIKANALRFKIILHEGMILDGRNRYRAMLAAGHTPTEGHFQEYEPAVPSDTPLSYVITANLHRRHLTTKQKREIIAKLLKASPEKSDREIGRIVKADNKTVASVRAEKEAREEIPHVETRADSKGRKQPAKKAAAKKPTKPASATRGKPDRRIIAPEVAERVGRFAYKLIQLDIDLARELIRLIWEHGAMERLWADLDTGVDIEERAVEDAAASTERRKAEFAALDDGADPGPLPESLRRRS